jgi:hypothetical protein
MEINSWIAILQEAREARHDFVKVEKTEQESYFEGNLFLQKLKSRFLDVAQQLWKYTSSIQNDRVSKEIIIPTRAALRYSMCCLSYEIEAVRLNLQEHAVLTCQWHVPLCTILCLPTGDSKCRLLTGQLLSNLVTCNPKTSLSLSMILPISPSEDWISSNIMETNLSENNNAIEKSKHDSTATISAIEGPNWVDAFLLSIKLGKRDTVAAVAATLHNCIVSLGDQSTSFRNNIASHPILISTILRNFILVTQTSIKKEDSPEQREWDGATGWFYLLITRLVRFGMLGVMYTGISGCSPDRLEDMQIVLPEQNVLLHCIVKYVIEDCQEDEFLSSGEGSEKEDLACKDTVGFLASLFGRLLQLQKESQSRNEDGDTTLLLESAIISILDILSTILGNNDSQTIVMLREYLGPTLVSDSARALGLLVDDIVQQNSGLKSREMKMSLQEQNVTTLLVQVLGNLCYGCRQNQDLMRTTMVPLLTTVEEEATALERNALHVLLSCTSLASCCFTLREWSVIAIRNVLDFNPQNQDLVTNLNAESAVQTAALASAGLQVQLDQTTGKVSLSLLEEEE